MSTDAAIIAGLIMLALGGCRTGAPPLIGAPLVQGIAESLDQQRVTPQYLIPSDSSTALLLTSFAQQRGIALGGRDIAISCPWTGRAPTGYVVQISVDSVVGNEATGSFRLSCSSPGRRGAFATGGIAKLRRVGKTWVIDKWLDRWIT